jgi:uncharacterized protein (TIGR04222 family)
MTTDRITMNDAPDAVSNEAAALLQRVEAFGLNEPGDPLGFESRLADDQGWTLGYALAVVEEYRRFLVLTQVTGHAASPSPDVDEAWHLHLTRTAHYEAFCNAVFGRFLHHAPARPGERSRHDEMYRQTLADYQQAFGATAPPVVWPRPGKSPPPRPAVPGWTVPATLRRGHRLAFAAVAGAFTGGLLLRAAGLLEPLQGVRAFPFLAAVLAATVTLGWWGLRARRAPAQAAARDRLEPYEAAWFSGAAERMAMTAIVALTERGVLLPPGRPSERGARPPIGLNMCVERHAMHPAEAVCLAAAGEGGLRFTAACVAMRSLAATYERRLIAAGIASDIAALPAHRAQALLGLVVLLAIEVERIVHGLGSPHPVGFLVLLALAACGLVVLLAQRLWRANARSERVLRPLRLAAGQYRKTTPVGPALAFGVALVGGTVLADDLRFDGLKQQVNAGTLAMATRRASKSKGDGDGDGSCSSCGSDGGSSCSSGDGGGSSCSSGCGGGGD